MAKLKIKQMEGIIEAILFTMGDSVEVGKIARALEQDEATTRKVIHKLMDKYSGRRQRNPHYRTGRCVSDVYKDRDV